MALGKQFIHTHFVPHFPYNKGGNALYIFPSQRTSLLLFNCRSVVTYYKDTPTNPESPLSLCSSLSWIRAQGIGQALLSPLMLLQESLVYALALWLILNRGESITHNPPCWGPVLALRNFSPKYSPQITDFKKFLPWHGVRNCHECLNSLHYFAILMKIAVFCALIYNWP